MEYFCKHSKNPGNMYTIWFNGFSFRKWLNSCGLPCGSDQEPVAQICLQIRRPEFDPWVRKIPLRRECQPTPVFLPGEFHGQKSLEGYSPWGHKESDTTEQLTQSQSQRCTFNNSFSECTFTAYLLCAGQLMYGPYLHRAICRKEQR